MNRIFIKVADRQALTMTHPNREEQVGVTKPAARVYEQMDLAGVRKGEAVRVRRLEGCHHLVSRLASLGFTPGVRLVVLQNFGHGPILVALRDTRIALGRGEAAQVLVEGCARDG